jgi:hypothetical protein
MSPPESPLARYRALEDQLRQIRSKNTPGSNLEDPVIEEMNVLWWKLTDAEREMLDAEGPTCWPKKE